MIGITKNKKTNKKTLKDIFKKKMINNDSDDDSEDDEPGFSLFGGNSNKLIHHRDNHIYFRTDITMDSVDKLINIINKKEREFIKLSKKSSVCEITPKPLYLHISSPGGSVHAGLLAADVIKNCKIPIHTVAEGYVASAATFLSVVGKKRYMRNTGSYLIHQLSSIICGRMTYEEQVDDFKNTTKLMDKIIDMYVEHTSLNRKQLRPMLRRDINWDIDECIKNGFIDEEFTNSNNY